MYIGGEKMHIKKLTKSESIKIIGHDFRHHETYKNKNVDKEKSCNNIVFEDCPNFSKIEKYLTDKEIYVHGKGGKSENKINFLCSVICHYPKGCPVSEREFFSNLHEILTSKFNNCQGSIVHCDEERSHIHFLFCPIVYDAKHERYKLCAKEVVNRKMLQTLHKDVEREFEQRYGYKVKLTRDETERGLKTNIDDIEEYKRVKDIIKKQELEIKKNKEQIAQEQEDYKYFAAEVIETIKEYEDINNEIIKKKQEQKEIAQKIEELEEDKQKLEISIADRILNEKAGNEYESTIKKYSEILR